MTSTQQRAALQRQIWKIGNDVRGAVDGWDFKQYVLGTLFYRFISENFANYIEADDASINYATLADSVITPEIKDDAIKTKGYFIYPSQLFVNLAKNANNNESLNTDLAKIFAEIESSANGYPSEQDIKGLFADFDTTSNRLGNTVTAKNVRLVAVLKGVAGLEFGDFHGSQIDLFGDAYEFLISNYAANAGKSGGEFFTPQHVSKLIAQLAIHKQETVNKIYHPACGSGSLLLQAKKHFDAHISENLDKEAAKRYIAASIKREFATENGTELNAIFPKMSPLNPEYLTKKQTVFQKISSFVEKFKGVGGEI
jgi:type I restriction enzyme M protein